MSAEPVAMESMSRSVCISLIFRWQNNCYFLSSLCRNIHFHSHAS